MTVKLTFALLCASFISINLSAQTLNKAKLDSLFDVLNTNHKSMVSLAISQKGKLIYSKAIGYSLISDQQKLPATVNTRYRIGSISKMFTGTMIFQLIEAGKLSLNTTLATYFPQIPNATKITIGEMLSHRSGIFNFTNDSTYASYMTQQKSEAEIVNIIQKYKPVFEPDSKSEYSNSNFILLGYILEKIYKKPYPAILKEKVLTPAGLKNTYYGGKTNIKNNEAYSYSYKNSNWIKEPETDMSIPGGAGALVSTPADLDLFIEALFEGKLVSASSVNQMQTIKDGFGMAMLTISFYEKKSYGHTGGIDGFQSMLSYFPDDQLAVAVCANGVDYKLNDIMIGVLSIYYNKPYRIPDFKSIDISDADFALYAGVYSSKEIPLKITIGKNSSQLTAQATGQSAFNLEQTVKNVFKYDAAHIQIDFDPAKHQFTLKQGKSYLFTKDK